jgi:hypothetical protein
MLKPLAWFRVDPTNPRNVSLYDELRRVRDSLVKRQLVPPICHTDGHFVEN